MSDDAEVGQKRPAEALEEGLNAKERRNAARAAKRAAYEAEQGAGAAGAEAAPEEGLNAKERRKAARAAKRAAYEAEQAAAGGAGAGGAGAGSSGEPKLTAKQRRAAKRAERRAAGGPDGNQGQPKKKQKKRYMRPRVFVGQLPFDATAERVEELFRSGGVEGDLTVRMRTEKGTGRFLGTAFVEVAGREALDQALACHHTLMGNRRVNVEASTAGGGNGEVRRKRIDERRLGQKMADTAKARELVEEFVSRGRLLKTDLDSDAVAFLGRLSARDQRLALNEFSQGMDKRRGRVANHTAYVMGLLGRYLQHGSDRRELKRRAEGL